MPPNNSNLLADAADVAATAKYPKLTLTFRDPLQPWRDTICVVAVTEENITRLKAKQVAEDMVNAVMDMVSGKDAKAIAKGMKFVTHR